MGSNPTNRIHWRNNNSIRPTQISKQIMIILPINNSMLNNWNNFIWNNKISNKLPTGSNSTFNISDLGKDQKLSKRKITNKAFKQLHLQYNKPPNKAAKTMLIFITRWRRANKKAHLVVHKKAKFSNNSSSNLSLNHNCKANSNLPHFLQRSEQI